MTAPTIEPGFHPTDLFFGNHDWVEALAGNREIETAKFTQGIPDALENARVMLHQVTGTKFITGFLVGESGKDYVTGEGQVFRLGFEDSREIHGNAMFHIQGAATPDETIDNPGFEGRVSPLLVGGGDYINVTIEEKRGGIASTLEAGDEVGAVGVIGDECRFETGVLEELVDVFDAGALIPRGVGGVETDEVLQ